MSTPLESWPREHYQEGGGHPFLFYVIYGEVDVEAPLAQSVYPTNGIPAGFDIMSYGPENSPDVPGSFLEGYLWEDIQQTDPKLANQIESADRCLVLQGIPEDDSTLDYFRDCIGLLTFFLDHGGVAIYDPFMLRWWDVESWKKEVFQHHSPVPQHHTVILISDEEEDDRVWIHTRGMRKFGRPDISVHHVPEELEEGVIDLCSRLIEYQAFGHVVPDGQEVKMASLPNGGVMNHAGDLEDPDFNNVHLEVELG